MNEKDISEKAVKFIKDNKKEIIHKFVIKKECPSLEHPFSIFMAGAPGSGKTEFSKILMGYFKNSKMDSAIRIDADEIRDLIPEYSGGNAHLFQYAASVGVDKIHDYVLKKGNNFILDGTFSNLEKSIENIKRSLGKNRIVIVSYMHQNPSLSWKFTQKREEKEGRKIVKKVFIEEFFASYNNVKKIKKIFGDKVLLWLIQHDLKKDKVLIDTKVGDIDQYVKMRYTEEELNKML